jgi:hypothetical protein
MPIRNFLPRRFVPHRIAEGSHIFKKDDWYYLTTAEGGTTGDHHQCIFRSKNPLGPFEEPPAGVNPIIHNIHHPRSQSTAAKKVSRPSWEWPLLCGRSAKNTTHQEPSGFGTVRRASRRGQPNHPQHSPPKGDPNRSCGFLQRTRWLLVGSVLGASATEQWPLMRQASYGNVQVYTLSSIDHGPSIIPIDRGQKLSR